MPVILPEDQFDAWLSGEAGKEILVPHPHERDGVSLKLLYLLLVSHANNWFADFKHSAACYPQAWTTKRCIASPSGRFPFDFEERCDLARPSHEELRTSLQKETEQGHGFRAGTSELTAGA